MSKPRKEPAPPAPDARIVEALSLIYVDGQGWVSLRYFIQGDQVVRVEPSEPDVRVVARGHFTLNVANMLLKEGAS